MKKLLFITTTNLSTNPRLLKELKLASKNGYECTFIGFKLGNWSDKTENEHLKSLKKVEAHYLTSTKSQVVDWLLSTLIWKLSNMLNKVFTKNLKINAYSHNKRTWQICKKLKQEKGNYDLIIAHNLGTIYPAYKFAKMIDTSFAFDIEDYHPGEKCSPAEKQRREFLMQKLLPKAAYISYASPLIGNYSFDLIKNLGRSKQASSLNRRGREVRALINNSFSQAEFQLIEHQEEKIRFVWFSQNIAAGRGLELIIPALAKFKKKIELTLIGNLYPQFKDSFLKDYIDFVKIQAPLPQKDLNMFLCQFDAGLAIELSSADFNRDICLTNKIFAYAQSGLYILATNTSAQKQFIEEHNVAISKRDFDSAQSPNTGPLKEVEIPSIKSPNARSLSEAEMPYVQSENEIGILSAQSTEAMENAISNIIDNIEIICANKKARFEYAKQLAWENEERKLLNIWNCVLDN